METNFSKQNIASSYAKKIPSLLRLALLVCILMASGKIYAQSVVAQNGRLQVNGNRIENEQGQAVDFAGPSLFWSNNGWGGDKFYNVGVVNWVKDDWDATIIRAAMGVEGGGGYADDPAGNKAKVETVVDAAIAAGIYVIIDFHTHDAPAYWAQSKAFFTEMAQKYGSSPNVIFEIYNEPLQVSWGSDIKPYAEDVISGIRAHSQNLVIVGTPTWSQDVDQVIGNAINDSNTAYTLHFYAGTHFGSLRAKGDAALNAGLALFVTEWGTVNADGNGSVNESSTNEWVSWMKANKLSHCNWSINDKAEGASAVNAGASTTGGWSDNDLTWSGGVVKSIVQSYSGNGNGGSDCDNATAISINGATAIEAESYCESEGVQLEDSSEGGQNVGYIDTDDWMAYRIDVPSTGTYQISYRVASLSGGGSIRFEQKGGTPLFGTISVPSTGGWQSWQTISHDVQLTAGVQSVAIAAGSGGWNLNWLEISGGGDPNECTSHAITGVIEAEDFCESEGIQLEDSSEGGQNVGYIDAGDWMSYRVNVPSTGTYMVSYRVASLTGNGSLSFEQKGGSPVFGTIGMPNTGGWQNWQTISHEVTLTAGEQDIAIAATATGWNLNWFEITGNSSGGPYTLSTSTTGSGSVSLNPAGGSYADGTVVTATATADAGWHFVSWSGDASGTNSSTDVTMNANKSITATFAADGSGGCSSSTAISLPFSHDGPGDFCWVTSGNIDIINSWAADLVEINGVDFTNAWANSMPARIDGNYYIHFSGTIGWAHFEATGSGGSARVREKIDHSIETTSDVVLYPNPTNHFIHLNIRDVQVDTKLIIHDFYGREVLSRSISENEIRIDISALMSGMYTLTVNNSVSKFIKR